MNEHANNPTPPPTPHIPPTDALPAELLAIGKALDELAALDRDAAGPLFEQRLAASTLPGLPLAEHVDALAGADRSAASSTLEDRIFVATRGLLNRPATAQADDAPAPMPIRIHVTSRLRSVLRLAAVLTLAGGTALLYWATRPNTAPGTNTESSIASTDRLASELDADFESLGAILSVAQNSDADSLTSTGLDADGNELEFPRLDLLDVEGSI